MTESRIDNNQNENPNPEKGILAIDTLSLLNTNILENPQLGLAMAVAEGLFLPGLSSETIFHNAEIIQAIIQERDPKFETLGISIGTKFYLPQRKHFQHGIVPHSVDFPFPDGYKYILDEIKDNIHDPQKLFHRTFRAAQNLIANVPSVKASGQYVRNVSEKVRNNQWFHQHPMYRLSTMYLKNNEIRHEVIQTLWGLQQYFDVPITLAIEPNPDDQTFENFINYLDFLKKRYPWLNIYPSWDISHIAEISEGENPIQLLENYIRANKANIVPTIEWDTYRKTRSRKEKIFQTHLGVFEGDIDIKELINLLANNQAFRPDIIIESHPARFGMLKEDITEYRKATRQFVR